MGNGQKIAMGGLAACGLLIKDDGRRTGCVLLNLDGHGVPILTNDIGTIRSVKRAAKRLSAFGGVK